jgi:protein MpaA
MAKGKRWRVLRRVEPEVWGRAHDSAWLRARWRRWARQAGWKWREETMPCGEKIGVVFSDEQRRDHRRAGYFSAGIHGDEAAGTLGLLLWAETNQHLLAKRAGVIFPCLNPWGLRENCRRNAAGVDLNRIWHDVAHPWRKFVDQQIAGRRFAFYATLHEDYDAAGMYLYEPLLPGLVGVGDKLLSSVGPVLPLDARKRIEGKAVTRPGLIQRRRVPVELENSLPEALYLLRHAGGGRVFTFETPSELDLPRRALAQQLFLQALAEICGREWTP